MAVVAYTVALSGCISVQHSKGLGGWTMQVDDALFPQVNIPQGPAAPAQKDIEMANSNVNENPITYAG